MIEKLIRDVSTPEKAQFWEFVDKIAATAPIVVSHRATMLKDGWLKESMEKAAEAASKLPKWALDLDAAQERGHV